MLVTKILSSRCSDASLRLLVSVKTNSRTKINWLFLYLRLRYSAHLQYT